MKRMAMVALGATVLLWDLAAAADPPAGPVKLGEGRGQVVLSWDEFVKITGYDPARKGAQVITIPWAEVEKLLGVEKIERVGQGATADLPWNEFKALLEWSLQRKADKEGPPPTDYIITSSQYEGALTSDGAEFTLALKLNILRKKGWKRIPILPRDVAVTAVTLPEGVHLNSTGKTYELLTDKSGAIEATVKFAVAVRTSGGTHQVGFSRILPGSSLLDLTVDRKDVDLKVAGSQSMTTRTVAGKEHYVAAVPSGVAVAVSWQRALPKVAAAPTKLYAETRTLVAVAEGLLLCEEVVKFNILHTAVRELKLSVPAGVSVLTVTGRNVQDWRVDKGELLVVLRAEEIGAYDLRVTYEAPAQDAVEIPVVRGTGVERERGFLAVIAVTNVEIAPGQVRGARTIDVRQLPADIVAMTNQPILLAFRYVGEKFNVPLTIKKHEEVALLPTIVDSAAFTGMQLADGRRMTKAVYSVRNNRNQFLRAWMPAGAEIWSVSVGGRTVSPAKDKEGSVLIPLVRSAGGAGELGAFPVEIVYVEAPDQPAAPSGRIRVNLPTLKTPVMHVMFSYYLPPEGRYTMSSGLFGSRSGFSGPLRVVDRFASLSTAAAGTVVQVDAAKQAKQMEQQFARRMDREVRAAGGTPIRIRLPVEGKLFKLEKILALPGDELYFEVQYSGWKVAK